MRLRPPAHVLRVARVLVVLAALCLGQLFAAGDAAAYPATYNPATYSCPSGGTLSGTTCYVSSGYGATWVDGYYYCPNGGTLSGTSCVTTSSYTAYRNWQSCPSGYYTSYYVGECWYRTSTNPCQYSGSSSYTEDIWTYNYSWPTGCFSSTNYTLRGYTWSCPYGGTLSSSGYPRKCTTTSSYTASYSSGYYYCPYGGTLSGSWCDTSYSYAATQTSAAYYSCPSGGILSGSRCLPGAMSVRDGTGSDVTYDAAPPLDGNWDVPSGGTIASYSWCITTNNGNACGTGAVASGSGSGRTSTSGIAPLTQGATYYTCARATDTSGDAGSWYCSNGVMYDSAPPAAPSAADGSSADIDYQSSAGTYVGSWSASAGTGSPISSYAYCLSTATDCGGTRLATGTAMATASSVTLSPLGLTHGTKYHFCVSAKDAAGNTSARGCTDGVTVDTVAPTHADNQVGDAAWRTTNSATYDVDFADTIQLGRYETIVWTGAAQTGTLRQGWTVGGALGGTAASTNWGLGSSTWSALAEGTNHVSVRVTDAAGNSATLVDAFTVRKDTVAPPAVTSLASAPLVNTSRALSWSTVTDATSGTAHYRVYRSTSGGTLGTKISTDGSVTVGGYTDSASLADGTYYYTVRPVDIAGLENTSTSNNQVAVRLSTTAPSIVDNQSGDATWRRANDGSYDVDFQDDIGLARFEIRVRSGAAEGGSLVQDWTQVATLSGTSANADWQLPAGTWNALPEGTSYVSVRLHDTAGNSATLVDAFTVSRDSVAAPIIPRVGDGIAGDAAWQNTRSQLVVNWDGVTDATAGVSRYETCFSTVTACGGTPVSSWTDRGLAGPVTVGSLSLAEATSYHACVRSVDRAGNVSAPTCSNGVTTDTMIGSAAVSDGPATDRDVQPSTTTAEANWPAVADATSGIREYEVCVSSVTSCGGSPVIAWRTNSLTTTLNQAGLSLGDGVTYYACVRVTDNASNVATSCSDGVRVDASAPTRPPRVLDGTTSDLEYSSSATLAASWDAASDPSPGAVDGYTWCFATSAACTSPVASGTTTALTASATPGGLVSGTRYYACIETRDTAGNGSGVACSDGVIHDDAAPTSPTSVDDGDDSDIDHVSSTTQLVARWTAGADAGVPGLRYEWCLLPTAPTGSCAGAIGSGVTSDLRIVTGAGGPYVEATRYYVCVRSRDGAGNVAASHSCSDGQYVDTTRPGSVSVADGSTADAAYTNDTSRLTFRWTPASDASPGVVASYDWCVVPAAASTTCSGAIGSGSATGLTHTTSAGGPYVDGTTYFACLRARDAAGNAAAAYTCSNGVRVDAVAPAAPTAGEMTPAAGTFATSIPTFSTTFEDEPSTSTGRIDFRIASDQACGTAFASYSSPSGMSTGQHASWTPPTLPAGRYVWCARRVDEAGNQGEWSSGLAFTLNYPPGVPILVAPADGAWVAGHNPVLSARFQDTDAGARGYVTFELCDGIPAGPWPSECGASHQAGYSSDRLAHDVAGRWAPLDDLVDGTRYYWHARGTDELDLTSDWSGTRSFRVDASTPSRPLGLAVTGRASGSRTIGWGASSDSHSGLAHYELQWSADGTAWSRVCITTLVACTQTGAAAEARATFRLRAVDNVANATSWEYLNDTPAPTGGSGPAIPAVEAPSDGERTSARPTARASYRHPAGVPGVVELQIASDTAFSRRVMLLSSEITPAGSAATVTIQVPEESHVWYLRARARDEQGRVSEWSRRSSFVTSIAPGRPRNLRPLDGGTVPARPTAMTSAFTDEDSGSSHSASEWQVRPRIGNYLDPVLAATGSASTSWQIAADLDPDAVYFWRARHRDDDGTWSAWSRETSFTVAETGGDGRLTIASPQAAETFSTNEVRVTGVARDGVAQTSLTVNDIPTRIDEQGLYDTVITLPSSPATIRVVAIDAWGVPTTAEVRVFTRTTTTYGGGRDGDDRIRCKRGRDELSTGAGNDVVDCVDPYATAWGSRDVVDCGPGIDTAEVDRYDRVIGCERVTRVWLGASQRQVFRGSAANERFEGKDGYDTIMCDGGIDRVLAGAGNDNVKCAEPARYVHRTGDHVDCGDGTWDRAYVDYGDTVEGCEMVVRVLIGLHGRDVLRGRNGNELVYGQRGNDVLSCGGGRDMASGGIGDDTISCADRVPSRANADVVNCGHGRRDSAVVDRFDKVIGCEKVRRIPG